MSDSSPRTKGIRDDGLAERLRQKYGSEIDPKISLDREPTGGATAPLEPVGPDRSGGASSGVLKRLGTRGPLDTRYRVDREIARGGMGAILEIWDEDLRRRLAMKVALNRTGDTEEQSAGAKAEELDRRVLARFLEEAQVTGQLDHPGIVPVHELGLDENGHVFFTMRLVKGRDLERVFEQVRKEREGWSVTRCLGVLLKVCEAMAYAHSRGVIHRDLKPANIMVGRFGEVYVMDWGIARVQGHQDQHDLTLAAKKENEGPLVAIDPRSDASGETSTELYTMDGDVVGTPAYMAPEQARGQLESLDARTDVYSMGAMLYQLLAGTAPYIPKDEQKSGGQVLIELVQGPPKPLESLTAEIPAELVAICEKAMAREASDRYQTMSDLAEDLRAFLEDRVVLAYETGAVAETRKWIRRNKPLATSLLAGIVALATGLLATLILKNRADDNAVLAETRRKESEAAAKEASLQMQNAQRQSEITQAVNSFLNDDLLAAVAPEHEGIDVTVREVLNAAGTRLDDRFEGQPLVEAELRMTIGKSFDRLGEYEPARVHAERAREIRTEELGEAAEPTLQSMLLVANVWSNQGRHDDARELYLKILRISRDSHGDEHRATLTTQNDLALVYVELGQFDEARKLYEATLDIERRTLGPEHEDSVATLNNLGTLTWQQGRLEECEAILTEALAIRRRTLSERHPAFLDSLNNLALVYADQGRYKEAETLHLEACRVRREVLGPDHPSTARGLGSLGVVYIEQGRFKEAETTIREGVEILTRVLGSDHPATMLAANNLAVAYEVQEKYEPALSLRIETLARQRAILGPKHPNTLTTMGNLAVLYRQLHRYEEAEKLYRETLALEREVLGPDHHTTLVTLENLGGLLYTTGDIEGSTEITREVLESRRRVLGEDHPDVAKTTYNLGMIAKSSRNPKEAEALFSQALASLRFSVGNHPTTAECLQQLADLKLDAREFDEAVALYRESIEVRRQLGLEDRAVGYMLHQVGYTFSQSGDYDRAIPPLEQAVAVRRRLHGDEDSVTLTSIYVLAYCLAKAERFEEAEPLALEYHERKSQGLHRRHPDRKLSQRLLRQLYTEWGKPEEAEKW